MASTGARELFGGVSVLIVLFFLLLLCLPSFLASHHKQFFSPSLPMLVLRYRYFVILNVVLLMFVLALFCLFRTSLISELFSVGSFFQVYGMGAFLLFFSSFSLWVIFEHRLLSIIPAIVGVIITMMASLFLLFAWGHGLFFSSKVLLLNLSYAMIMAVLYFRYSCLLGNYYSASII